MLTVRNAQDSDLDELVSMNLEVHLIHLQGRPDEFKALSSEDMRSRLRVSLLDKDHGILVCVDGDELLGYIFFRLVRREENPFQFARQYLYIDQIDVKVKYQRHGVGKKLIEAVVEMAKHKGIDHIMLDVWEFNEGAQAFFESQGFTPWIHRMGMNLINTKHGPLK